MNNSQISQNSYSQQRPNGSKYANIIATVSVALALLFWGLIYNKLEQLDSRLRTVEQASTAILAVHNLVQPGLNQPIISTSGRSIPPGSAISP